MQLNLPAKLVNLLDSIILLHMLFPQVKNELPTRQDRFVQDLNISVITLSQSLMKCEHNLYEASYIHVMEASAVC